MLSFFGGKEKSGGGSAGSGRTTRNSSGWGELLKRMRIDESLRVLDIGPTSSGNINFITGLGHSIYLANLVEDAAKPVWTIQDEGQASRFDVEKFLSAHLDFSGRGFDVVLFWDTADYLPEQVLAPVLERLHTVMAPGGELLAMFHSAGGPSVTTLPAAPFSRYHLTDQPVVEVQRAGDYPVLHSYTNRQIEKLFAAFSGFHFFLSKDNVREVVVRR